MKTVMAYMLSGPLKGHKYFVKTDGALLIGRSKDANIQIGYDDHCSRKHALLYWESNTFYIKDLDSTNGTFVNNARINGKFKLSKGDVVSLGSTQVLIGAEDCPNN